MSNTNNSDSKKRSKVKWSALRFHQLSWVEIGVIILSTWFLFYPEPYTLLFTVMLLIPLVGLIVNGFTGRPSIATLGEIGKDKDGEEDYDIAAFINLPAIVLLVRVFRDFEFESWRSLVIPGTIGFVAVLIVLIATHRMVERSTKSKTWIYFSVFGSVLLYSYAGTIGANCVYDYSEPKVYEAKVLSKEISNTKSRFYILHVQPWGAESEIESVRVTSEEFEVIHPGETVKIDVKQGLFGIPWYFVERH